MPKGYRSLYGAIMNSKEFIEVRLPSSWGSYIANNDESGLEEGEKELIDSTLEHLELNRSHCADVLDDSHFELPFYPDLLAGEYCTYIFYQL